MLKKDEDAISELSHKMLIETSIYLDIHEIL